MSSPQFKHKSNVPSVFLMGLEVMSPLVLLLMRLKHGHIEVAPATHSITDEIKLLRLTSGSL